MGDFIEEIIGEDEKYPSVSANLKCPKGGCGRKPGLLIGQEVVHVLV